MTVSIIIDTELKYKLFKPAPRKFDVLSKSNCLELPFGNIKCFEMMHVVHSSESLQRVRRTSGGTDGTC